MLESLRSLTLRLIRLPVPSSYVQRGQGTSGNAEAPLSPSFTGRG
jgi:hypothetical protein